eukprot:scaffold116242_cov71-Attheya_sp.AAC.2
MPRFSVPRQSSGPILPHAFIPNNPICYTRRQTEAYHSGTGNILSRSLQGLEDTEGPCLSS